MALRLAKRPSRVKLRGRAEAICPISKSVDQYEVEVEYIPRESALLIEKFQEILQSYRGVEILHEELAVDIAEKIKSIISPSYIKVVVKSNYRGIYIEAIYEVGGQPAIYI
ncbi:GTP cyclohydrolase I [Thermoproteus tenax]|uniref:GTP cyclohydrolase I n=1 Tax=Thermoproteus tenax (strain ATCC 35583 / DSM 2078 / JCM 9277 / NBRC 100435 / Kra 1) TaxID=768679 RepID=G4RLZ5_THETK|nr:GTP cyclohydrolase I [Thermoproteus tenax]CCC82590.1 GTP cyclohydrolase I [Thermoproteus tenax Kra 1]